MWGGREVQGACTSTAQAAIFTLFIMIGSPPHSREPSHFRSNRESFNGRVVFILTRADTVNKHYMQRLSNKIERKLQKPHIIMVAVCVLSLIHISEPRDQLSSRMPSSA